MGNAPLLEAVIASLSKPDAGSTQLAGKLMETLAYVDSQKRLGPSWDGLDWTYKGYAEILTLAGLLEEHGNKMQPISYTITEKGKQVYAAFID